MAVMTQTAIDKIAKELYPQKNIMRMVIEDSALLGLVEKRTDFKGKYQVVGLRYGMPTGRSADLGKAITNANPSAVESFKVTRVKDYSVAGIDTETIRSADGDVGALVDALDFEIGGALEALKRSLAISLFRNRGGSIGRHSAGAITGTGPFTLSIPEEISNFEKGMVLQLATTDGTSGAVKPGTLTVASVDRNNGSFTTTALWNTVGAASDYIFADGDFGVKLSGLAGWLPAVAPTVGGGDSFFGVDRAAGDVERLSGVRPPAGNGAPIEQTLLNAVGYMARNRSKPDTIFLNNQDWMNLVISMGSRRVLTNVESTVPELGYEALVIAGPKGNIKVLADPNCPKGTAYILQMDTWKFWTLGDLGFIMEDNLRMLRHTTEDSYTWRLGYYGNLVCDAPGWNAIVAL